jgi:predicted transcriptional regulator
MEEPSETLLALTADIVAAHVSNNTVASGDVATLISNVHRALSGLGTPAAEPAPSKRGPAVSPRSAIKPDTITCLVCGLKSKMLKRHLATAHDLTPQQYREEFGLRPDYPMVAPNYAEARRDLAKKIGLGRSGRGRKAAGSEAAAPPKAAPKGRRGGRTKQE